MRPGTRVLVLLLAPQCVARPRRKATGVADSRAPSCRVQPPRTNVPASAAERCRDTGSFALLTSARADRLEVTPPASSYVQTVSSCR